MSIFMHPFVSQKIHVTEFFYRYSIERMPDAFGAPKT